MGKRTVAFLVAAALATSSFAQTKGTVAKTAVTGQSKMDVFVSNLMKQMTLDEKIGQLNLVTPGGAVTGAVVSSDVDNKIKSGQVGGMFGITGADKIRKAQEIAVNNSRLKIPMIFGLDVIHGHKTIFPIPLGLSCSWDMPMIQQSAQIAAKEATADGLAWVFSPMVDICRDPRWGRIAECSGEDPYLGSQIATAMVKGYQGDDLSKNNTVMACVKHYALYGAAEAGRDYNTTDMSRVQMFQNYFPPYKAAVDAGVGSVMSAFNEVDAVPSTVNKWLLTDVLRDQWKFKGMVVTDYTSINEMIDHGMGNLQQVSAKALNAGVDMDMVGEGFLTTLKKSLSEGKVSLKQIDAACKRILEAKYKLGLFDDPYRYCDANRAGDIFNASNRASARDFATRSAVLLKNANQTLPLKKSGTIALVGPLADSHMNMLGTWSVSGDFVNTVTVLQGLQNVGGSNIKIIHAKGANISDDTAFAKKVNAFMNEIDIDKRSPQEMIDEAINAANKSDVVVAVLGESANMSGESSSLSNIDLQPSQKKLLDALKKTGKPVVLVLMNGRPMTIEEETKKADAILDVWFSGTEAGNAIADLLFGDKVPSGKLTASFPVNVGQIPVYYNHKNTGRPYVKGGPTKFKSNYLDIPNEPLFEFGYGLSYSTFSYSSVKLSAGTMTKAGTIKASVTLTNTGNYDGEEVVQLYIRDIVGSVTRPLKELKGFQKVFLKKGESKEISFTITADMLAFYDSNLKYASEPGDFKVFIGGSSATMNEAGFELR
ncbi:beta-glucosidase BglX [Pinibacter aurantiacus]|uniref:Periplasmic beta-glucosidase n=1 Tax=Pinibacter aurantiacus TaxID=2851599 RepID=A0A9E2W4W1_9BACT|nr:beta-glucosidase BglX [Pinibacter aurantiacus]MBV4357963.1 beta-glucosidase BglX [Pinibacter aurantiacus]